MVNVKLLVFLFLAITLCWAGRPDIVHPCKLKDYKCIGAYLAANSNCNNNVTGYLPNPFHVDRFRFETPSFNSSHIDTNLIARNFDKCKISKFFFNRKTKRAVVGIDCPNFDVEADRQLIRHHSLKEDTYYKYHVRAIYPLIRVTVILPQATQMNLCIANVFADVTALPKIYMDPKDRAKFLPKNTAELAIFERENWYYRGFPIARIIIDTFICDYNCYPRILD